MSDFSTNLLFTVLDYKKSGEISKAAIWNLIGPIFEGSQPEYANAVFNCMYLLCNESGSHPMNYEQFNHFIRTMTPFYELQNTIKVKPELQIVPLMKGIFNGIDTDDNKKLDKEEIQNSVKKLEKLQVTDPKVDAKIRSVLSSITSYSQQLKEDQEITETEFMKICVSPIVFKAYNTLQFEKVFQKFDTDGSGTIDFMELQYALKILFPCGIDAERPTETILCCVNKDLVSKNLKMKDMNCLSMTRDVFINRFCPVAYELKDNKENLDEKAFYTVCFHLLDVDKSGFLEANELKPIFVAKGKDPSKILKKFGKNPQVSLDKFLETFTK